MTVPVAFDPKWAMVVAMSYLEGAAGATIVAAEKGAAPYLYSCAVSTSVSRWGSRGSVFFPSGSDAPYIQLGVRSFVSNVPKVIQGSFYPTDITGTRFVFVFYDRVLFTISDGVLTLRLRTSATPTPEYTITLSGVTPGQWYDYAIRFYSVGASLEVNGVMAGAVTWGSETHRAETTNAFIGNAFNSSPAAAFRGYFGPWRWTEGDTRDEDIGQPAYRFPVLGAVDPHRESVVFHSHFEGLNQSSDFFDTCGLPMVAVGSARINAVTKAFGVTCCDLQGGYVRIGPSPKLHLAAHDFEFEWFEQRSTVTGNPEYSFAINNSDSTDHGLSLRSINNGAAVLRVNGLDVASFSSSGSSGSMANFLLVRRDGIISLYRAGVLRGSYEIGAASISADGFLYLGRGPVGPVFGAPARIDEMRLTVGFARTNPLLASIPVPTEKFSDYGPRSLSGHVLDHDGTPVQCTVRCYHASSGRLVSESVSDVDGSFVLPTADLTEHFWTAHHPTKNALIFDHIQPALVE